MAPPSTAHLLYIRMYVRTDTVVFIGVSVEVMPSARWKPTFQEGRGSRAAVAAPTRVPPPRHTVRPPPRVRPIVTSPIVTDPRRSERQDILSWPTWPDGWRFCRRPRHKCRAVTGSWPHITLYGATGKGGSRERTRGGVTDPPCFMSDPTDRAGLAGFEGQAIS